MIKVLLIILYLLSVNVNLTAYADESPTKNDIVDIFKRSMNHWKINYDNLDENKSGAACIPWQQIDKTFVKEGIFTALGYGFNLYDIKIAKKAALEGCERMRKANNIMNTCKCEMVLYNNDILLE